VVRREGIDNGPMSAPLPTLREPHIELKLQNVRQLFNSLDPSPFYDKDLDDNAEGFLISWAEEFPRNTPLTLLLHLPAAEAEAAEATRLAEAIHHHFQRQAANTAFQFRAKLRDGRLSLAIGLLFLFSCVGLRNLVLGMWPGDFYAETLAEGLLISGWVAMWRPIQTFLYDWWPIRRRLRLLERLAVMPVAIRRY
jgi:hypothetical protein